MLTYATVCNVKHITGTGESGRGMSIENRRVSIWRNTFIVGVFLLVTVLFSSVVLVSSEVRAIPARINYQGRLTDASGTAKPDGQYNMKFRIYSAASGGTLLWSETRETTNRVTLTDGQFNVQLGLVTAIPSSVFAGGSTYFEVELPTPASATCSTAACGVYTEGAMSPRQPVSSSAYALNTDTLDGFDSYDFGRLDSVNSWNDQQIFNVGAEFNNATLVAFDGTSAFNVTTASFEQMLKVDTTNKQVSIGTGASGSNYFGTNTIGGMQDVGDFDNMNFSRFLTGGTAGATSQASVYMAGPIGASPNNKYTIAIYSGTATTPTTRIAVSSEGTLAVGWNTVAISATLSPSTYYWVGYNSNGTGVPESNNMSYDETGTSFYKVNAYTTGFPSTITGGTTGGNQKFSMYVEFAGTGAALTTTNSGMVGINTTSPTATLDVAGTARFKNKADSVSAFQITNAAADSLFVADATNSRIQIGSVAADATGVVLVLDTKNTSGDPTGVVGAMYYNSNMGKFRCYEGAAWNNCIPQTVVTLASDVVNNNATANTIADVTGLSFPVVSGRTYRFSALVYYTAAATTTGSRWSINGPTTSMLAFTSRYGATATTETFNYATAYNAPASVNVSSPATTGNIALIDGVLTPSANGTVVVRFSSEVSSSAITAKAGSTLTYW